MHVARRKVWPYTHLITSTHANVRYAPKNMARKYRPVTAAEDVEAALGLLEGRWKLVILFHLFGGKVLRFSDLQRAIPNITQKMLGQQLRRMETEGIGAQGLSRSTSQGAVQSHGMGSGAVSGAGRDFEVGESPAEDVKWRLLRGNLASFDQSVSTQFDSPSEVARGGQAIPQRA
jgi:hypothetical protein